MYIPTIFFGQQGCVQCSFTGSYVPDGVEIGKVSSATEDYFYIIATNTEFTFDVVGGSTSAAKLLLVGGGGRASVYNSNPLNPGDSSAGGGGAGEVIYRDIDLGVGRYFMSASRGGIISASEENGKPSEFIVNYDKPVSEQIKFIARGGFENNNSTGGASGGNLFSGGTGTVNTAGGGGGGSNGNGQNRQGNDGGDGGDGTSIDAPFSTPLGYSKVAGGGPGDSYNNFAGSYAPGITVGAYGNGGRGAGNVGDDGEIGVAALFVPITNCNSGSFTSNFEAEGGDSVGTFVSGGVQYKYHLFTTPSISSGENRHLFKVTQGFTNEAQTMQIGGGAGSSVSASVGTAIGTPGARGGGAGAGGLVIHDNVAFLGYNNVIEVGRGGRGGFPQTGGGSNTNRQEGNNTLIESKEYEFFADFTAFGGGEGATDISGSTGTRGSGGGGSSYVGFTAGATPSADPFNIAFRGGNGLKTGPDAGDGCGGGGGGAGGVGSHASSSVVGVGGDGYDISTGFWSFLTGSFSSGKIGYGGAGGFRDDQYPSTASLHSGSTNDGSGANPEYKVSGSDGFAVIVYPISGTTDNSQV